MLALILTIIIFLRYLLVSYFLEKLTIKNNPELVFNGKRKPGQKKKEIRHSLVSAIIFGIGMSGLYELYLAGYITVYLDAQKTWYYHLFSILAALFIHETYYYWLHRAMHIPKVYRYIHQGHHDSIIVSSWTSFSFDWLESIFQVLIFYIIALIIPLHIYSILFLLIFLTISATVNDLNIEVYPRFFRNTFPFKYLIGATHHALHHKEFRTNYGLYFTFWDQWMNTESKKYKAYINDDPSISK